MRQHQHFYEPSGSPRELTSLVSHAANVKTLSVRIRLESDPVAVIGSYLIKNWAKLLHH